MLNLIFASAVDVENVWTDAFKPLRDVNPPPDPASDPQENFPVTESHKIFPDDGSQAPSPAPNKYPEFRFSPVVTASPPAIVEVAVVEVALKNPNVGVDVAVIFPEASVESKELIATDESIGARLNVFVPLHTLFVVVPNAREIAFVFLCIGYVNVSGLSYVPKSETCDFVIERFGRAVIPEIDDEADNLLSKSVLDQYLFVLPCVNASVVVAEKNV